MLFRNDVLAAAGAALLEVSFLGSAKWTPPLGHGIIMVMACGEAPSRMYSNL